MLVAVIMLAGCETMPASGKERMSIHPLKNNDQAGLEAVDVVNILKRANVSDELIIEHGRDFRNCLAASGAANVKVGRFTEMICAVQYPHVMVSTRLHGSFVYDLESHEFR